MLKNFIFSDFIEPFHYAKKQKQENIQVIKYYLEKDIQNETVNLRIRQSLYMYFLEVFDEYVLGTIK